MAVPHDPSFSYSFCQEFGDRFLRKRVLVTGATGFVGTNLCQALRSIGAEVAGVALAESLLHAPDPEGILPADLADEASARGTVETVKPEIVFHLAGMVDTRQDTECILPTLRHNLIGTVNLLTALVGSQCSRVLVVGSSESPPPNQSPGSPYAASKQAAAIYAQMYWALYALPVVIARPHMVYGPHQQVRKLIPYLIHCGLQKTPPLLSSGKRICDLVYVKDFVRAMLLMAGASGLVGQTLDVGTGTGTSIAEVVSHVRSLMSSTIEPVFGALPDRAGEVPQVANRRHTEEILGWRPLWTLDAGLSETIRWYKNEQSFDASSREDQRSEV